MWQKEPVKTKYIILRTWMCCVIAEFAEWITECDQLWKKEHQIWTTVGLWGKILALRASYAGSKLIDGIKHDKKLIFIRGQ